MLNMVLFNFPNLIIYLNISCFLSWSGNCIIFLRVNVLPTIKASFLAMVFTGSGGLVEYEARQYISTFELNFLENLGVIIIL